jgi:nucleoside-diphosphate-sugar epimerase
VRDNLVRDQDAVIHLAFVIPTLSATGVGSEEDPERARKINVGGTRNLIQAIQKQPNPPNIIFTSSLHIYGRTHDQPPPRVVGDPPHPIEHYAQHKVICENMLQESGLNWANYRLGAALPLRLVLDQAMFGVPLDNRIEFVHSRDVALALANGLESNGVWGRVWHIGGGPSCQLYQREIVEGVLAAVGLDMLPEEAFTQVPFPTDWLETSESQKLLQFQERTLQNYLEELKALLGFRRHLIRLFRPLIRWWMLRQSPLWARSKAVAVDGEKVATVAGASSGIGRATARHRGFQRHR